MSQTLSHRSLSQSTVLLPGEQAVLVNCARSLKQASRSGTSQPLLRGKKIGLLCGAPDSAEARLFYGAATRLGAHVSQIRPGEPHWSQPEEVQHTGEVLGRLYDAIECQGLAHDVVVQLERASGVPVYEGLATTSHPTRALAEQLGDGAATDEDRCFVLQAVLLNTIS